MPSILESDELFITNIVLEYEPNNAAPDDLTLVIFSPYHKMGASLPLEKKSVTLWEHDGLVEMPGVGEELIMIAFWGSELEGRKVFYHSVAGDEFAAGDPDAGLGRKFVADIDSPTFTVKFDVCMIMEVEQLENQGQGAGDVEMLDDIAGTTSLEQEVPQAELEVPDDNFTGMLPLLTDIRMLFSRRFEHTRDLADISKAVATERRLVSCTPDGYPYLSDSLINLGISLFTHFECTGDISDISGSISARERAINLIPEDDEDMVSLLTTLGVSYMSRFPLTQDLSDVSKAISAYEKAVQLASEGDEDLPVLLNELGESWMRYFQRKGDLRDISEAIKAQERAVRLTLNDNENLPGRLNNLGLSYFCLFEHSGDIKDITQAISLQQKAVNLTSENHKDMPTLLNSIGSSFMLRFECTGDHLDIEAATSVLRKAARLAPEGHELAPAVLNSLGMALWGCFKRSGDINDISEAISVHQRALNLISASEQANCFNNLGISFQHRFEVYGDLLDISEAISALQKSISVTPKHHPKMPTRLNNLATAFMVRFEHSGHLDDISDAISTQQRAMHLIPDDHATVPILLNTLGVALSGRFECNKDLTDISDAILAHERAVKSTSKDHIHLPTYLNNLGLSFRLRFSQTENLEDISKAISAQKRAVELSSERHPYLPTWLNNLGTCLFLSFKSTKDVNTISEAISAQEKAIELTPEGHGLMPSLLASLADSFLSRFEYNQARSDLEAAIYNYRQSANGRSGPPSVRLDAAKQWAICALKMNPSESEVMTAYETAIRLASQVAGLEQTIQRRHSNLIVNISDQVLTTAAAAAISFGRLGTAVEWLEHGRCLVWSQINNLRTPLDDLRDHDQEELANRFSAVSMALEKLGSRTESRIPNTEDNLQDRMTLQDEVHKHIKLAREWEKLLHDIRNINGFQDFLQPRSISSLLSLVPKAGPVVIINVHSARCDALALLSGADTPIHIPLDKHSYARASTLRGRLHRVHKGRSRGDEEEGVRAGGLSTQDYSLRQILLELWLCVVKPILNRLAISSDTTTNPPRIWWCATGPLAFLPIHAAGIYGRDKERRECLSDFAISSYTPTVSGLVERVIERPSAECPRPNSFLLVSQPNAPGHHPIPETATEVNAIWTELSTHGVHALRVENEAATVDRVKDEMATHCSIHLACHGIQDTSHPLQSGFIMRDGRRLKLSDIIKVQNTHADLAFLSACHTSAGDEKLSEEAIHLAGGMLVAGYRSVVATMWAINDMRAVEITNNFYGNLLSCSPEPGKWEGPTSARAPYALHHACQSMRRKLGDSEGALRVWVPYVHFGI